MVAFDYTQGHTNIRTRTQERTHIRSDSSGRGIGPSQRTLSDNIQH